MRRTMKASEASAPARQAIAAVRPRVSARALAIERPQAETRWARVMAICISVRGGDRLQTSDFRLQKEVVSDPQSVDGNQFSVVSPPRAYNIAAATHEPESRRRLNAMRIIESHSSS